MKLITPHELVGNQRDVWWNDLEKDIPIKIELIDYFNAPVFERGYIRRGVYVVYYCIARSDYEPLGIMNGDDFLFSFSAGSLCLAIKKLPNNLTLPCTKEFADGKNCLMELKRISKNAIKILHQEATEPTPEQLEEAKKQYAILRQEDKQRLEKERENRERR